MSNTPQSNTNAQPRQDPLVPRSNNLPEQQVEPLPSSDQQQINPGNENAAATQQIGQEKDNENPCSN